MIDTIIWLITAATTIIIPIILVIEVVKYIKRGKRMVKDETEVVICKVWLQSKNATKLITVPKKSYIKTGDYVKLVKVQ